MEAAADPLTLRSLESFHKRQMNMKHSSCWRASVPANFLSLKRLTETERDNEREGDRDRKREREKQKEQESEI